MEEFIFKQCKQCGKSFKTKYKLRNYCCDKCRGIAERRRREARKQQPADEPVAAVHIEEKKRDAAGQDITELTLAKCGQNCDGCFGNQDGVCTVLRQIIDENCPFKKEA